MGVILSEFAGVGAQFFDNSGNVLTGGKIFSYAAGTTTPLATYTTFAGNINHSNPIILDASGRVPSGGEIWVEENASYKFVLTDSNNVLIATYDNIDSLYVGTDLANTTDPTKGDALVGFRQSNSAGNLANAVGRTVHQKLQESVSVADFGAVGDGVADDTTAIRNAVAAQKPLLWTGSVGNTFKITGSVTQNVNADVIWDGQGATITYAGGHVEYAIRLNDTTGVSFLINDLTIDGSKLCNKALEVLNNTSNATSSSFIANNLFLTRVKRLNTFSDGDGILVRGAFSDVTFNGGGASDCELPAGQGTPGSVGISGITVTWYSTTSYPKRMVVNNISINKVYSSDLAYQSDQDGIRYFVPDNTSGTSKVPSQFVSNNGSSYVNCYGRSIKTQCRDTIVENSFFERTEGLTSGQGNGEIDAQTGNGTFRSLTFNYSNGQQSGTCVNVSGSIGQPGIYVDGCVVVCDSATTILSFAQVFPSAGTFSRHTVSNNKVYGKVQAFFQFLCNGDKNYVEVSNNYVNEIVNGVTSEKALIYVQTSGAITPFFANIIAYGNVYDNTDLPALVRDAIAGNSMQSSTSAWNNYGFLTDDITKQLVSSGLQTNVAARLGKVAAETGSSYFKVLSFSIAGGATTTVPVYSNSATATIIFINAQFNANAYGIFVNNSASNTVIAKGSSFEFGNTTNPGTGTFRVWSSATNEISIQNTNASSRDFSLFIMNT
jgi:hypothetical protein